MLCRGRWATIRWRTRNASRNDDGAVISRSLVTTLACLALFGGAAIAQTPATDAEWNALGTLDQGTPLIVRTSDGEIEDLEFIRRDQDIIVLSNSLEGVRKYRRDMVEAVWRFDPPKRGRNALLGFLIGAGVGAGMTAISVERGRDFAHPGAMGIVGGAVGAGIGAWISSPSRVLLYPGEAPQ